LGSFSKVLAPGLRLGYLVAPPSIFPKLLQAKQAADLHTSTFDQRIAYEVIKDGYLQTHTPQIRALYRKQRDLMLSELDSRMASLGVRWNVPAGGMFIWVRLPPGMNAEQLLCKSVNQGVAFVPGAPFYAGPADARSLRLSFVNATPEQISIGITRLSSVIRHDAANFIQ
jgi:2-aminoadipate transaminase